jgi:hypothetical protein
MRKNPAADAVAAPAANDDSRTRKRYPIPLFPPPLCSPETKTVDGGAS